MKRWEPEHRKATVTNPPSERIQQVGTGLLQVRPTTRYEALFDKHIDDDLAAVVVVDLCI